jgi:uncharacterized protein (TIGR02421 family)
MNTRLQRIGELDRAITGIGPKIRVLSSIAWPKSMEAVFLKQWRAGEPRLPEPGIRPMDLQAEREALLAIMRQCDTADPLGRYLHHTAWSYAVAAEMLMNMGRPRFTECSVLLYGRPDHRYRGQTESNLDAAEAMLRTTDELTGSYRIPPTIPDIPSERFAELLRQRVEGFFHENPVTVVVDPSIASKATAGSRTIKIRSDTLFSDLDLEQLVQHEAFIHSATMLNGRRQTVLATLGLGAPRTTRTQEGLATFAEIISDSLDIVRLRRLALRVRMVKLALEGADLIEVFKGFLAGGQSEEEAYRSAERIFRGGDPRGHICFTKDATYLEGTFKVSLFMRKALQEGRPELIDHLFAGRLTLADTMTLDPLFKDGTLAGAHYKPPWAQDPRRLLALLAFFSAFHRFSLEGFVMDDLGQFEEEQVETSGMK